MWGFDITNTYDAGNRVTNVADSLGGSLTVGYDISDRPTSQSFTDGTVGLRVNYTFDDRDSLTEADRYSDSSGTTLIGKTLYGYDDSDRLTSITHKNASNTTLDSFTYTLDDDGFVSQETSTLGPTRNNTYDGNSQLTGNGTDTYAWDANGNNASYTIGADTHAPIRVSN